MLVTLWNVPLDQAETTSSPGIFPWSILLSSISLFFGSTLPPPTPPTTNKEDASQHLSKSPSRGPDLVIYLLAI